jgi:hypothetical protein
VGIKHGDRLQWTTHGAVRFVPMTGEVRRPSAGYCLTR